MFLITMSGISLALALARCPSSVQNGAERKARSSCRVETWDVRALSHGAERALRKAPDCRSRNMRTFSSPVPCNHTTWMGVRAAIKYSNDSPYLLLDAG